MDIDTKTIHLVDAKFDDAKGSVSAVIATLGIMDKDGDVTLPGFFGKQKTAMVWAHQRSEPVGKGVLFEDGDVARFEGRFFIETTQGLERYKTVKAMGELQDWSYGFRILDGGASFGDHEGRQVRFLQPNPNTGEPGVKVDEVSPVLVGAGEGTGTTAIKSDGLRFVDQAEQVAQAAELLFARAEEIKQLRSDKGGELGAEAVARLLDVKARLTQAADAFGGLADEPPPPEPDPDYAADLWRARQNVDAARVVAGR